MVFQSLYQPVENIASWTRFWCALDNGYLSFWRYPEDEMKKVNYCQINLKFHVFHNFFFKGYIPGTSGCH